jgi:hypothetical protein
MGMLQGKGTIRDEDTRYLLLHAERLTAMLAHLHAGRLLAEQARRFPQRRPLAERAMRRAVCVCADAALAIKSGDRSTLKQITEWEAAGS